MFVIFSFIRCRKKWCKYYFAICTQLLCSLILYEVADENIGCVSWFTDFVVRFCRASKPRPQKSVDFVVRLTSPLVRPVLEYSQTVWDSYTETGTKHLESVQRRAARFTLSRYRRTSSVGAMLNELNWEPLASRCRAARLVMFYKIHHKLVEVNMPLDQKLHVWPTHKENSLACHIPTTSTDYQKNSFLHRTVPDWNCLPEDTVHQPLNPSGLVSLHEISPQSGTSLLLVKGSCNPSVRSEGLPTVVVALWLLA